MSSVEPFRPRVAERVNRSPELLDSETLGRESHECKTKKKKSMLSVPISVARGSSATIFCFFGGGGGRYVITLCFFCGGSFRVKDPILSGSLNFPLLTSDAVNLRLLLKAAPFRVGGFRVDHSESGEGGN